MNFNGFNKNDFDTFKLEELQDRMEAIQERIQPKFQAISDDVKDELSLILGQDMFLHIARHARRKVNPPSDTWSAYCHNKRGYKQHPHFQVGLFDDHVFIWLAFIYELPHKTEIAQRFMEEKDTIIETIPNDFVISLDHMKKFAEPLETIDLDHALTRFRDIKKGEFLIGRQIEATDPILKDGDKFINLVHDTFKTLTPLYKLSMR
ncbi:YktB family protein [Salipaludibacillus sp. HK11]|uniref:YktB family protein n=1 Tax=Salipaludibacillus sp. HK11 TaxID=3394320 RepID=UPI0039FD6D18